MTEIIIALIGVVGGSLGQYVVSTKFMPKKEEREADQIFIDTLIERINLLEARIDTQTLVLNKMIKENSTLKAELEYFKKDMGKR